MLWGKKGWESELNLLMMGFERTYFDLEQSRGNTQELLWEHERQLLKNLEFYTYWRSSILLQLRSKLLALWFICHWHLKSHVPWTTRIRITWQVEVIIWLEIEMLEDLFWRDAHAESRSCGRTDIYPDCLPESVESTHEQHVTLWEIGKHVHHIQGYCSFWCRQSELP